MATSTEDISEEKENIKAPQVREPSLTNSAVFLTLFKGGGIKPMFIFCVCKFVIILKAFWQHKIDIKRLLRVGLKLRVKLSKFQGKFDMVSTNLCLILLNFVATDV